MAGERALSAFCFLVVLLQVRAQVDCYPDATCGQSGQAAVQVASALECCLQGESTELRSYRGAGECQECIVIGFEEPNIGINENEATGQGISIVLITPSSGLNPLARIGTFSVNVAVNSMSSTATLGNDYNFDFTGGMTSISGQFSLVLPATINVQIVNDLDPGEVEHFVMEMSDAEIVAGATTFEVLIANSLTVNIIDDDVLQIQFERSEYTVAESNIRADILFTISNPIIVDTHFYVLAMTYEEFDLQYANLSMTYPELQQFTLNNEYDQAEPEDFISRKVPFTVPANQAMVNETVEIVVVDDNLLEPVEEGFRLLLIVDTERTPISQVTFADGRQLALFRIDDTTDTFTFGFENETVYFQDRPGTHDIALPLTIRRNSRTEIPITLRFNLGSGSTATEGEDFDDFTSGQIDIINFNMFDPQATFQVTIRGDDLFEPEENIVINLARPNELRLPAPFQASLIASPMDSVVRGPSDNRIIFDLAFTTIVIQGADNLFVTLGVPEVVQEGASFFPVITVSQLAIAGFFLIAEPGTITLGSDIAFYFEQVDFDGQNLALPARVAVSTIEDNLVEPNETISIRIGIIDDPAGIGNYLTYIPGSQADVVIVIDNNTAIIGFREVTQEVSELAENVTVTVAVLGDRLAENAQVTVRFYTEAGTASVGEFEAIDRNLVFTGDEQEIDITIQINDDLVFENSETFTANLMFVDSNVDTEINPPQSVITITDNDPVVIGFDMATYSASEQQGWVILTINVTAGVPQNGFELQLQASNGSAGVGVDFFGVDQVFQLNSTQFTYMFNVTIVDDGVLELVEEFSVSLMRVTQEGNIEITPAMATVRIADNDELVIGFTQPTYSGSEGMSVVPLVTIVSGQLAPSLTVEVEILTSNGTAIAPGDYSAMSRILSFTSTTVQNDFSVPLSSDNLFEDTEHFFASLSLVSTSLPVRFDLDQAQLEIMDESGISVGFTVGDQDIDEDNGIVTLVVSVIPGSGTLQRSIDITYRTVDLTVGNAATSNNDYTFQTGTVTFDSDIMTANITINITSDSVVEIDEVFEVLLESSVPRLTLSPSSAMITIRNDDTATIGFVLPSYEFEESSSIGTMEIRVTGELDISVSVLVSTTPGTAAAGVDYESIMLQELVFNSSVTTLSIDLGILPDQLVEIGETLTASLQLQDGALSSVIILNPMSTLITILDSNTAIIGFTEVALDVLEDDDSINVTVAVMGSVLASGAEVTIRIYTEPGTASDADFGAIDANLTFTSDKQEITVEISIVDDEMFENPENFTANLVQIASNVGLQVNPPQATITILNDDPVVLGFNMATYRASEEQGWIILTVTVIEGIPQDGFELQLLASNDSAEGGIDFSGVDQVFQLNSAQLTYDFNITIADDGVLEGLEGFFVSLTSVTQDGSVEITPDMAIVSITDNDELVIGFTEPAYSASEGMSVIPRIRIISGQLAPSLMVDIAISTSDGTAIAPSDYSTMSSMLTFASDITEHDYPVPLSTDDAFEDTEYFLASLSLATMSLPVRFNLNQTQLIILDESDITFGFEIDDQSIDEDSGTVTLVVSLIPGTGTLERSVEITYRTVEQTSGNIATSDDDYVNSSGTLTFDSNTPNASIVISINPDSVVEYDEVFGVLLETSTPRVMLSPSSALVTIRNDDSASIGFELPTYIFLESDGAGTINVILTGELNIDVSVRVSTMGGTATAGTDFTPIMQTLTFNETVTIIPLTLDIAVDEFVEGDESLTANLMLVDSSQGNVIGLFPMDTDITITDSSTVVIGFSPDSYSIVESEGHVGLMIQVLSGQLAKNVTVILETLGHGLIGEISGSAMDLTPISQQTVVFSDSMPKVVDVAITPDMKLEMDERFFARLSSSEMGVVINPSQAQVTIVNDDVVEIGFDGMMYTASEGDGFVDITFGIRNNVRISGSSDPVVVQFQSAEGTATVSSDYSCGPPTTYTFTSTETQFTVRCTITSDDVSENLEMFTVSISTTSPNVVLSPDNAVVDINDDDKVTFSFDRSVYMVDENEGQANIVITKTGSSDYPRSVSFVGGVENGMSVSLDIVFNSTDSRVEVQVPLFDDEIALEDVDMYPLSLQIPSSETGAELGQFPTATYEVSDNDLLVLTLVAPSVIVESEVNYFVFVNANRDVATPLELIVFTSDNMTAGAALGGEDYVPFNQTVTLQPGEPLERQITAMIINDNRFEQLDEPFVINAVVQGPLSDIVEFTESEADINIRDDDDLTIGFRTVMYSVIEGVGSLTFEVEIKNSVTTAIPVELEVTDTEREALRMMDYAELGTLPLTIQPGQTSVQSSIVIVDDNVTELAEETFTLSLQPQTSRVSSLTGFDMAVVAIADNDNVTIGFDKPTYTVGENDTVVQVCVEIVDGSLASGRNVTVQFTTSDGLAIAPSDYTEVVVTFMLTSTKASECIDIPITSDDVFEMEEKFTVVLDSSDPSVDLDPDDAEITIVDDDGVRVSFKLDQYIYSEGDGNAVVEVVLMGDTALDVVVTVSGGPSSQVEIGTDRVVFSDSVTFTPGGPKEHTVSAVILDDMIALEADEIVDVDLTIDSPASGVNFGAFPSTRVIIVDNDVLMVNLVGPSQLLVQESNGTIELCVSKNLQTVTDVTLDLEYIDDTASVGFDYNPIANSVTIPANSLQECFLLEIVDDTMDEPDMERFNVRVVYSGTANVSVGPPAMFEITIQDNDEPIGKVCVLDESLVLQAFSNSLVMGPSFSLSEGCERRLVTTCNEDTLDLEIRVDFFQNDFTSTKVYIYYEGASVIINDDLSLLPPTSPSNEIVYMSSLDMVSVSIPEIMFVVTRNLSRLSVSFENDSLPLGGLCGSTDGQLYFPDCMSIADPGESLDSFKQSFKVKPSDQLLRGERKECGITANDTVVGDPLMTVPVHAPGYPSDLHLCYEIHGAADQYFNLVSDECTSVNAHYAQAPGASFLNIIDSMGFVVVDTQGICHQISVDVENCTATIDGEVLHPMSRKRTVLNSPYEQNGVSVRSYTSRVRISVPNCADNSLVMWVVCQHQSIEDPMTDTTIGPIDMIKFEITRGLNLKETSHGLLGQFWNIPVVVTNFTGVVKVSTEDSEYSYHTVTISHPSSTPRSFTGILYDLTWEFESKQCLYVGNRQGGPIGEVDNPNDSVIEGSYQDYHTNGAFMTDFDYTVFDTSKCSNF